MKNFLLPALAALAVLLDGCQQQPKNSLAMCHDPNAATVAFASLANDRNFRDAHDLRTAAAPVLEGRMVAFPTADGTPGGGYFVKAATDTTRYLLLLHEWWGLNDYVKAEADFWSNELNINVLAIDLYDGNVAADRETAGKLMQSNEAKRSETIIRGAMSFAGDKADFRTMGWCFGGGWSLQTALLAGAKLKGCVMFYGMPEKDVNKLRTLTSDVIFIHASRDQWINDVVVEQFEANMLEVGARLKVYRFDADHAFANPSSPRYDEAAAQEARRVVKNYLSGK